MSVELELQQEQEQEQVQDGREITGFGAVFIEGNPGKQEEKETMNTTFQLSVFVLETRTLFPTFLYIIIIIIVI